MYFYEREPGGVGFLVRDESRAVVARCGLEEDAREVVAALNFVERATARFPGLDGSTELDEDGYLIEEPVNGTELVDLWNGHFLFGEEGRYRER